MLSASFTHEANGNTTADGRANLTFTYNLLNLPETVTSGNTQTATYHWLADGTKYRVEDATGSGVIYAGDLTYAVTVSGGTPTYALESAEASADGTARFLKNRTAMTPYYTIRDHLGSVRTIVNASGTVVERNDYYPFGTRTTFGASYATLSANRQKFSGKEDQTTVASSPLPYLDFGARMYDPKLVRWNTYDPMAEKYYGINPYVYCAGDPVNLVDQEGKDVWEVDKSGRIKKTERNKQVDSFYLIDDKGTRSESISFDYGTVTSTKRSSRLLDRKTTTIKLSSEEAGADLFKFFADNLQIEFGLITIKKRGGTIVSSHKESEVPVSDEAKKLNREWDSHITRIIHNHPGNTGPSGFRPGQTEGDKASAKKMLKAEHYVYIPSSESLIRYDEKRIYDTKKWDEVFPITVKYK